MRTYQDLMEATNREDFIVQAIKEFQGSTDYKNAQDGEAYYNKHNLTIEKYQKTLRTVTGREVPDIFSSNYKLKTLFLRRLIMQQVQYVLGNGVILSDENNKEKLGRDFDFQLQTAAKRAMAAGRAFGFWNYDHLEVFGYADTPAGAGFCPLYDEETAELRAGIRFWFKTVGTKTITRATLYEEDGLTEYITDAETKKLVEQKEKAAYKQVVTVNGAGAIERTMSENYTRLPIITLYANDSHESELIGIRECIDAYDFIKSGLANDIDDTSGFFWILQNTGGMDDTDLAQFVQRMKQVHAAVAEEGQVEAHTMDVPVESRSRMLEILRRDIYEDFQALDVQTLSAAAKTTQEIQAAYQAQDNKCADFEYFILDFVQQILELAGIDDNPTLTWNRVVNQAEQTNMILAAANYLTDDMIIKKLPFLTPEEADQVIGVRDQEDYNQFGTGSDE